MECKVVGSRAALEKAKFNAENYYSVIGDVSDLEATLSVLENYLPRYFNGASHIYRQMSLESSSTSRWGYKCILISCKFWAPNTIRISCLLWNSYKEGIEKCINDLNCQPREQWEGTTDWKAFTESLQEDVRSVQEKRDAEQERVDRRGAGNSGSKYDLRIRILQLC